MAYHESFADGDARTGAYQCQLTLSDPGGWTMQGGPATASHGASSAGWL